MTAEKLAGLLARRFEATGAGGGPVSLDELHDRLVPYPLCREELGLVTKAEYDLALLRLLEEPGYLEVEDEDLRDAVQRELDSPEPGLEFLANFSATLLHPGEDLPPADAVAGEAEGPSGGGADDDTEPGAAGEVGDGPGSAADEPAGDRAEGAADEPTGGLSAPAASSGSEAGASPAAGQDTLLPTGECTGCGRSLPERGDLRYCPYCGADQTVRRCPECSVQLEDDWSFCPACGARAGA